MPWSSFDGLLVKVISKVRSTSLCVLLAERTVLTKYREQDGQLSLMATDLETVYFESLTPRQLNRRLEDALGTLNAQSQSQTQSEGIMVGIGDEGERLLRESVAALVAAVADGSATVEISHEAFEVRPFALCLLSLIHI